jgi:topoisomerase IV subunit B
MNKHVTPPEGEYSARDIEVLEGLEPVRRRPAMYIGGTDERALHHLFAEVLDNAMDEAVAGHADRIHVEFLADGSLRVTDNGRGIPVDRHPKFKDKSALEVVLTMLHSGGKFSDKVYRTAGGLHGVGLSVVNALSDHLQVEVARERELWRQEYEKGAPKTKLKKVGAASNRRGTTVTFHPDPEIFGPDATFQPARLFRMARSRAYLFPGAAIHWHCAAERLKKGDETPAEATLHFPGGLQDYLGALLENRQALTATPFVGKMELPKDRGRVEWAIAWPADEESFLSSYCNTVPTPDGGTHEAGLRAALLRGLKGYGELTNNRRASVITAEDVLGGAVALLSVFVRDPQFQGQTKERLANADATKLVDGAVKDHFDHWLSAAPDQANALIARVIERAEERLKRKQDKDVARKSATRKLRLPGKLSDCSRDASDGTEIFIVEGDSAGGSAKQGRNRELQAVLPLRGKILNVASANSAKMMANQELADLIQALGCGAGARYDEKGLRYEKVIIMTDADVDGAHIASLLMTFFYREMPKLIDDGHLFLALPPLYRISQGGKTLYARDDAHKDELMKSEFAGRGKVEVSRFKGLGEMPPAQLKETTMDPKRRTLLKVVVEKPAKATDKLVESLMGRKPELRLKFIQENADFARDLDV